MTFFARWRERLSVENARGAAKRAVERLRSIDEPTLVHAMLFFALAALTVRMLYRAPIGPGQDYHYHLMSAAMDARSDSDPLRALYHRIHPLDANSLAYRVAWPFVRWLGPLRGFQVAVAVLFYVGFPAAVWYALRRSGRAPWGSLIAFITVYTRGWAVDGFVPFLSSGSIMVLVVAEWNALLRQEDPQPKSAMIRGTIAAVLLFLAHAHTFGWTALWLGVFTCGAVGRELFASSDRRVRERVRAAVILAGRSLVMIAPALILLVLWRARLEGHAPPLPPPPPGTEWKYPGVEVVLRNAILAAPYFLIPIKEAFDLRFVAGIIVVVVSLALLTRGDPSRSRHFEVLLLVSLASYFVLPVTINGQSIATRHMEFTLWMAPLVLWPSAAFDRRPESERQKRAWWLPEAALALLLSMFVSNRLESIERAMVNLNQQELGPMLQLVEPCRRAKRQPYSILAYVPMATESRFVQSVSMHQAHETLAALCGVETPVYNTNIRPFHTPPLRYRVPMPAPTGVYQSAYDWPDPGLGIFRHYDLVLTYAWSPNEAQQAILDASSTLVGVSGPYRLYRRR
ncbi:MAG: hypothetical protein JNK05_13740 [Myxococcales bacterium]|nr:hypothetical protein [Myxococcales bacterium]